jgi:hypothetical protein
MNRKCQYKKIKKENPNLITYDEELTLFDAAIRRARL